MTLKSLRELEKLRVKKEPEVKAKWDHPHWHIDNDGTIEYIGPDYPGYFIEGSRLTRENWILHMSRKEWVDMNVFIPVYIHALTIIGVKTITISLQEIERHNSVSYRYGKREQISKGLSVRVFQKDNFKCVYCGQGPEDSVLQVDHIHPVALGGRNELENLQTLCIDCNAGKRDYIIQKKKSKGQNKND